MNIDNNIGGSAHQSRSQHIEKRAVEPAVAESQQTISGGSRISFVNALESTSLANVLWTVNNEAAANSSPSPVNTELTSQLDTAWFRQAYTEH